MTPTEQDKELREQIDSWSYGKYSDRIDELLDLITAYTNKQVEGVLDRLLDGTTTIHLDTQPNNPVESKIEPMFFKAEIKAAIEAERNKLKESTND